MKAISRYLCASIALALFAYASVIVGRDGLSYFYLQSASDNSSMAAAEEAIRLNPTSPDAFHARAALFQQADQIREAISDLNRAVDLRPRDHFLWLELGYCRYQIHDIEGAIADLRESARLAPFYAQPRWYLGNVLLQTGKPNEGFEEIRRAVSSDPFYLQSAIQLAEQAYGGDAQAIAQAIRPETSINRLVVAEYFIKQNEVPAALALFTEAGADISAVDKRTLIADLLAAKRFSEAHELWLSGRPDSQKVTSLITDGGFENEIEPGASGFDWHISPNLQRVSVAHDQNHPQSGSFSLRLDFNGSSSPDIPIVSQILLTDAAARYQLDLAYRTRQLVTGGPPIIAVVDASDGQVLGQSKPLPRDQTEWVNDSIQFLTHQTTKAVTIVIQREKCSSFPCPAFGYAWFDSLDLRKL